MNNWSRSVLAILIVAAFAAVGSVQASDSAQNMPTDKAFLDKVSEINLAEVELGTLAQRKGNNEAVRQFGTLMADDHSVAEKATEQVASDLKETIPEKPGKDVAELEAQLSRLRGAEFDVEYMHHMVAGHNGAVAMIENEIEHGQEPAIKAFAEKILPTVQDHLRIAENLSGRMGLSGKEGLSQPNKAIIAPARPR